MIYDTRHNLLGINSPSIIGKSYKADSIEFLIPSLNEKMTKSSS